MNELKFSDGTLVDACGLDAYEIEAAIEDAARARTSRLAAPWEREHPIAALRVRLVFWWTLLPKRSILSRLPWAVRRRLYAHGWNGAFSFHKS